MKHRSGMQPSSRRAGVPTPTLYNTRIQHSPYLNYAANISSPTQYTSIDNSQIENSSGAFIWKVDDFQRLKRFLVLGSEGGTYYINEKQLTKENGECVRKLLTDGKGVDVVNLIKQFSLEGRTFKQNSLIFTLAICARLGDSETKKAAYNAIEAILRIPTHLFTFVEFCELLSGVGTGWGRAHRRAISNWYNNKTTKNLSYLVTKYQSRNGWSHRDVLRLAHVKPIDSIHDVVYRFITQKKLPTPEKEADFMEEEHLETIEFLKAFEGIKTETDEKQIIEHIQKWNLAREHLPTTFLNSVEIWRQLLQKMPLTAMIRNLGKMTSMRILNSTFSSETNKIVENLTNAEYIHKSRIHPMTILLALKMYMRGKGMKGKLTWTPNRAISDALDKAFYLSFKNVEPTGKRFLLALDVSGSMGFNTCAGTPITPCEASTALSMITAASESKCDIMGFSYDFRPLNISPHRRLDDNMREACDRNFGSTDCSLPMVWAMQEKREYDVFIIYTDSETNSFSSTHPSRALQMYRNKMNLPHAKLIVMGMTSNGFTIADPNDNGMLDVVGFDSSVPQIIREFVME